MKPVLLDANILLAQAQFKVDIWRELERLGYAPVLLSCVIGEVNKLAAGKSKHAAAARVALNLIELKNPRMVSERGPVDKTLIRVAQKTGYAVATNDMELIGRLKKKGITIVRLKQRKYLAEE
jgi:hypothetical protein